MNVLSLFDGMSGGQLALVKAGIKYEKYFASEIDKYAIAVTQHRFPDTIQLGSVLDIDLEALPKIDLLIAGSPCQGFSFAGKQLNFEDERSKLFFEFVRILNYLQPKYFLLENVKMKKEYQDVITNLVGVEPIEINSTLVSAQNRKRLYWTNIKGVKQPKDKGIMLKDILEDGFLIKEEFYKNRPERTYTKKTPTIMSGRQGLDVVCIQVGEADDINGHDILKRIYSDEGKSPALTTMGGGHREPKVACGAFRGRYKVDGVRQDGKMKTAGLTKQELEVRQDGKTNTLKTVQKDNVVVLSEKDSLVNIRDKSKCVRSSGLRSYDRHEWGPVDDNHWRKLTPLECERLQTVPDNYTLVPWQKRMMSNSQRYKMLGNGFTVDVIAHILKHINTNPEMR